jgi:hypothetical protein
MEIKYCEQTTKVCIICVNVTIDVNIRMMDRAQNEKLHSNTRKAGRQKTSTTANVL